jgi:hypothetical protein
MVSAVELGASERPTHRVTVSFQRVKAGKVDNSSMRRLHLSMDITQRLKPPFRDLLSGVPPLYSELVSEQVPNGRWFDLPAGRYKFTFDLFAPPQPPRHITDFDVRAVGNGKNRILESVATRNNLGEGTHTLVTPDHIEDLFGIEFTISVRRFPRDQQDPATRPDDPLAGDATR